MVYFENVVWFKVYYFAIAVSNADLFMKKSFMLPYTGIWRRQCRGDICSMHGMAQMCMH